MTVLKFVLEDCHVCQVTDPEPVMSAGRHGDLGNPIHLASLQIPPQTQKYEVGV